MSQRRKFLRVVWEPVPDAAFREKLRQAFEIIFSEEGRQPPAHGFDENALLAQYEAGAGKKPGSNKGRVSNAS